jgi:hypothetical protein
MTVRLVSVLAFGSFAVATAAEPIHHVTESTPFVLNTVQLDAVSAGLTLVLPPTEGAAAVAFQNGPVPINSGITYGMRLELEVGTGASGVLNLHVSAPVPFSQVGPIP